VQAQNPPDTLSFLELLRLSQTQSAGLLELVLMDIAPSLSTNVTG